MAYCGQATQANANYLASKTGLNPEVALAWLKNECQSVPNPTNPLNIIYNGASVSGADRQVGKSGRFAVYNTTQAGLDAAANQINHSSYYAGIRAAIKTGNPWAQAKAIQDSPWAGGHYGYAHIVNALATITGQKAPAGYTGKSSGIPQAGPLPNTTLPSVTLASLTTTTPISADQWNAFVGCVAKNGAIKSIGTDTLPQINSCASSNNIDFAAYGVDPSQFVGKSLTDLLNAMVAKNAVPPQNIGAIVPDVAGAIGAVGGGIVAGITYIGALILVLFGLWLFARNKTNKVQVEAAPGPSPLDAAAKDAGEAAVG